MTEKDILFNPLNDLEYTPRQVLEELLINSEMPVTTVPGTDDIIRTQIHSKTKELNIAMRIDEEARNISSATMLGQVPLNIAKEYAFLASQEPIQGGGVVTTPDGFLGIQETKPLPISRIDFEAGVIHSLKETTFYADEIYPVTLQQAIQNCNEQ